MADYLSSILFSYFYVTLFCSIQISVLSFSVDLIHRDSPKSPFYNPSLSHYDRLHDSFRRSTIRANYFHKITTKSTDDIQSQVLPAGGGYVVKLSIGTPPILVYVIADTGSDLTWVQCKPCDHCYPQNLPIFNPGQSSTYRKVPCDAKACSYLFPFGCSDDNTCKYEEKYGDESYSNGDIVSETFTLGSSSGRNVSIPNVFFGCGHNNGGTFSKFDNGIFGLGGGQISFVQQINSKIDGKFSYCLVGSDASGPGKINFGNSAIVSGTDVVSTPLITKSQDTFYHLTLESISVGNKSLTYKSLADFSNEEGNVIIDSGTTLTYLPSDFIKALESELKKAIGKAPTSDPSLQFSLCYKVEDNIKVPTVTVRFTGAELDLSGDSVFLQINDKLVCLMIVVASDGISIFGNLGQMNYLVGFDLVNKKVSFKPKDCAKN